MDYTFMELLTLFGEPTGPNKKVSVTEDIDVLFSENNEKIMRPRKGGEKKMKTNRSSSKFSNVFSVVHPYCHMAEWYASAVCDAAEDNRSPLGLVTTRPVSMRPRVCGAGGNLSLRGLAKARPVSCEFQRHGSAK